MPEFRLFFFGLIAHIGNDTSKTHAVLVDAQKNRHKPLIYFARKDRRKLDRYDTIWFSNGTGSVTTSATFRTYVPHLQQLTGSSIKTSVLKHTNKKEVAINVFYPPSPHALTAQDLYPDEKAVYRRDGQSFHNNCVARLTSLRVPFTGSAVTVFGDGENLGAVKDGGCILIANVDEHFKPFLRLLAKILKFGVLAPLFLRRPKHVEEFKLLVEPEKIATLHEEDSDCSKVDLGVPPPCNWIGDVLDSKLFRRTATQIECGNTQWP